jgi:hypothetical protein
MPLLHDNIDCGAPANSDACSRPELCSLRPACSCAGGGGLVRPSHELRPRIPACRTGAALELTPRRAFVAWTEADEPACSTTAKWPPAHAATAPRKL